MGIAPFQPMIFPLRLSAMQPDTFTELYPLFSAASPETVEWLLSVATHHEYPANRAVVMEDAWGNAVYFIEAGWVKVRRHVDDRFITLAVLGKGDFFGEMAILDESPRSTDVVAMTAVTLMSISAQRFIQTLFKDSQLHHRLLQLMVQRLRQTNLRLQLRQQPPAVKLANTLVSLQEAYGQPVEAGVELLNMTPQDLADLSDITAEEASKIMAKLTEKGWVISDPNRAVLTLTSPKQLAHLAGRL
jgi:CRP/FNR family transcriptional regulator, cyclic AMP receptor protein